MTTIFFSKDHEYAAVDGDVATVGISHHAQEALGDVVFVDPPKLGARVAKGDAVAVVESVKAASDIFSPVSGEIIAVNDALSAAPGIVNEDAMGKGWIFKVRMDAAPEGLMDQAAYDSFLASIA